MAEEQKSSDQLYLERLKFNPKLRKSWLNFFVSNFRVVILLILLISAWGVFSYLKLPRESNPEVKIPIAILTTVFPGASPGDVEELVTKKIETGISGLKGIDKITSNSSNSFSAITVEFSAGENLDDSIRKLKDKIDSIKSDLPDNSEDPSVNEISFDDTPILTVSLTGPYDGFTLRDVGQKIKDELEKIPGAREVNISGGDEKEFEVAYRPDKLTFFNISPNEANQIIAATNQAFPAGNFEGEKFNYSVRIDSRFFDEEKLKNTPVSHTEDGGLVYLKDIAEVKEKAIKKTVFSRLSVKGETPEEAVTISVVKKLGSSIILTSDKSKEKIEEIVKSSPAGTKFAVNNDFAKQIRTQFEQLTHDFILTLLLVFLVLLFLVGLKEAFVAGAAIPLVFFVTFGVMDLTGITLNFLSIFSLLLSLGLLVDDAIVVVSATKQYLSTGKFTPEEAVLLVLNDFKWVLTTTTLTTVWAFLPLLLATGIIGEFIKSIPITVTVTLISSLLVALMINHPLAAVLERVRLKRSFFYLSEFFLVSLASFLLTLKTTLGYFLASFLFLFFFLLLFWFLKKGRSKAIRNEKLVEMEWANPELIKQKLFKQGQIGKKNFWEKILHGAFNINVVLPLYEKHLRASIKTKKRRLAILFGIFLLFLGSITLPATGIVPTEFFPASDEDTIYLNIEAPTGMNLAETDLITKKVEERLLGYPEIANFSTIIGKASSANRASGGLGTNTSNLSSIVITLLDEKEREITSYNLATEIREDLEKNVQGAKISVESVRGGPPSGASFEAQIMGEDLQRLDKIANDLERILKNIKGVINTDISLKEAPAEYTFKLDPEKMEFYNLNTALIGGSLRMAISGIEVTKVFKGKKEEKVTATFAKDQLPDLQSLQNIQILNLKKQPVFLKDVAEINLNPSVNSITRIDQKRAIILSSGVEGKTRPNEVLKEFQNQVEKNYKLPEGYSLTYGGENEQNNESVASILKAMMLAALLIVSTLIIQFNSFKKALIVLVTFPLALIGVFVGMAIFQISLSFPGLIGILALFGIVVKNAIILIDKINLNLKSGIPFEDSIVDAGKSRLEAIFITSICTILGIIPVTLSNEVWTALGGAIIFGLTLSSFLTLMVVPVMFATIIKDRERF